MSKKKEIEKTKKELEDKRIQDLINIQDIEGDLLYTKDGYIQGFVGVIPVNISLLSQAEKRRKRDLLKEKLNQEKEFEFVKLSKSVDLSRQINYLQDLAKEEENHIKKMGLLESVRATSRYSQQGEMVENQYYYVFRTKYEDSHSEKELRDKLFDFVNKLDECEIKSYILNDMEITQISTLFCNPSTYSEDMDLDYYISSFIN